jgi:hypothetical protein
MSHDNEYHFNEPITNTVTTINHDGTMEANPTIQTATAQIMNNLPQQVQQMATQLPSTTQQTPGEIADLFMNGSSSIAQQSIQQIAEQIVTDLSPADQEMLTQLSEQLLNGLTNSTPQTMGQFMELFSNTLVPVLQNQGAPTVVPQTDHVAPTINSGHEQIPSSNDIAVTTTSFEPVAEVDEEKEYRSEMTCKICRTNVNQLALQCGHMSCSFCLDKITLKICPFCSEPIKNVTKLFFS